MNKCILLPKLAVTGIRKNRSTYLPYMLITSFSVFVFFIFMAISDNKMMYDLPHAMYVMMLMEIGKVLLGIILAPILFSTNKFLVKQRKSELGLYNVLGLDRKYIGVTLLIETFLIYGITLVLGLITATVFSKLIYLFLLNITGLPIDTQFTGSIKSYVVTALYFGVVALFNLAINLWQVSKAKPIDLMKSSKKGEKEVKFRGIKTLIGLCILGLGYYTALITELNSMIFINFFLAVLFVIIGTIQLFKVVTISVLRRMKANPKIYYQKNNFVTLSGMLYRMKRNAQSLASICIFSTMIIITLICTVSLFRGQEGAIRFNYPFDSIYSFNARSFNQAEALEQEIKRLAEEIDIKIKDQIAFDYQKLHVLKEENTFKENAKSEGRGDNAFTIKLLTLEDYNDTQGKQEVLNEDEVLIFSTHKDFGYDTVVIGDITYKVKEELQNLNFESKEERNIATISYYIVMPKGEQIEQLATSMNQKAENDKIYTVRFNLGGTDKQAETFIKQLNHWCQNSAGFNSSKDIISWAKDVRAMNGGLLFLGIFFGIVFSVCLVLLMYYKQISEGFEDKKNFEVLKQVGMSDKEVRLTIRKQILIVFFLPLVVAVAHTFVGLHIVKGLLSTLHLYNDALILESSYGVILFFAVLYVVSYTMTSKAYYKIVK